MKEYTVVKTKVELRNAIKNETKHIVIADKSLAKNIRTVKIASKAGLTLAIASAGIAVTNFWNPVGLTAGLVSTISSGTLITAIVTLGIGSTFIWAIYNNYSIKAKGKYTSKNGVTCEGEIILERD